MRKIKINFRFFQSCLKKSILLYVLGIIISIRCSPVLLYYDASKPLKIERKPSHKIMIVKFFDERDEKTVKSGKVRNMFYSGDKIFKDEISENITSLLSRDLKNTGLFEEVIALNDNQLHNDFDEIADNGIKKNVLFYWWDI